MAIITIQHYRCDQCGQEAVGPVRGWWLLLPIDSRLPNDLTLPSADPVPDRHFCSNRCLARWAANNARGAR